MIKNIRPPLFIIGNPRSGTSLLRLLLTTHHEIVIPPECGFVVWLFSKYGTWEKKDSRDAKRRNMFVSDLALTRKFETWGLASEEIQEAIRRNQPDGYGELSGVVYLAYGSHLGRECSLWGDKNNFYIDYLEKLFEIWPNAKFLHIVRDGRDVACSYREVMRSEVRSRYAPRLETHLENIAHEWTGNLEKVGRFAASIADDQSLTVKYEDLVVRPTDVCKIICKWLQMEYDPEMKNFYRENKRLRLEPAETMAWKQKTDHPIDASGVGRYMNELNSDECKDFEKIAGDALAQYGYFDRG